MLIQYTGDKGGGEGKCKHKHHATPATSAGRHDHIPDEKERGHCMSVYRACVLTVEYMPVKRGGVPACVYRAYLHSKTVHTYRKYELMKVKNDRDEGVQK